MLCLGMVAKITFDFSITKVLLNRPTALLGEARSRFHFFSPPPPIDNPIFADGRRRRTLIAEGRIMRSCYCCFEEPTRSARGLLVSLLSPSPPAPEVIGYRPSSSSSSSSSSCFQTPVPVQNALGEEDNKWHNEIP